MKTKLAVLFIALTSGSALAHDNSYDLEIEYNSDHVKHTQRDLNGNEWSKKDTSSDWLFTYYFDDVDTSFGPLAEAAFLNRSSNISLPVGGNESSLGFEYFGSSHNFYLRLQNENNFHDQLHLGYMLDNNWLVAVHGNYNDFDGGRYGIYSKKVFSLDSGGFLNLKVGYDESRFATTYGSDTEQYYLEMDYYVDRNLSYGVTISDNKDIFNNDKYSVEFRSQWFVTDNLSLGLSYSNGTVETNRYFSDGSSTEFQIDHVIAAKVKYRF